MVEDAIERLDFMREEPRRALAIGDPERHLRRHLEARGTEVVSAQIAEFDEARPWPFADFDLIVALGGFETVNDLPGALIHLRAALAPGGLAIAAMPAAGSLTKLRAILQAADGDRPAARMHPMVDVRAGAQLLQRAGLADPVADSHSVNVRYSSLASLVNDLRDMGLSSALADRGPPFSRQTFQRAKDAFAAAADAHGKLAETFEILTLSGRRPVRQTL